MTITRKPSAKTKSTAAVDAVIAKGGSVPNKRKAKKVHAIALRIPDDLLQRIDQLLEGRAVRIPRHTWILEAIAERLERESG